MQDHGEHNPKDHEDPLAGPTWLIGFIAVVLLNVVFLGLTSLYYGAKEENAALTVDAVEPLDLVTLETRQRKRLETPAGNLRTLVNGKVIRQRIVLPIDTAMDLVVEEFGE